MEDEFRKIGLDETNIKNILKSKAKAQALHEVIQESGVTGDTELKAIGNLLYTLANKIPTSSLQHRPVLARFIGEGKLKNLLQVEAAIDYVKSLPPEENIADNLAQFDAATGVGIVPVSRETITAAVADFLKEGSEARQQLTTERYLCNVGPFLLKLRKHKILKWAEGKELKEELDRQVAEILGPKTAADEEALKAPRKKVEKPAKAAAAKPDTNNNAAAAVDEEEEIKSYDKFIGRDLLAARNSKRLIEEHEKITGGKIMTRFPPEPNGYLHIGHAKAMNLSFGYAKEMGGMTYLRYDDTNPDAEKDEYIKSIEKTVRWLGWEPFKITYSSDYFDKLYEFAVELIKKGLAYVDHQTPEEMSKYREQMMDSPWRDRPVEENLKLFEDMRKGKFAEGAATLRLKMDMKSPNYTMRDLVAYRIKYTPHPKVGDKWCIFPSYDYTHCIVDSLEHITHSLCTLEFEVRRDPYYWILNALDLYRPNVWEFSRLNLTTNVMSKRKLNKLVTGHIVDGWDDPRILTVDGLKRRGYTPEAINAFCRRIGVTRNENMINIQLLEHYCRRDLDQNAPRAFAVLNPLKVTITNFPEDKEVIEVLAPNFPAKPDSEKHKLPLSRVLYIERSDFRLVDSKDYFGLAPNKEVGLKYAYNIRCTEAVTCKNPETGEEEVVELFATMDFNNANKPKGYIHWVAEPRKGVEPAVAEVRIYEDLFTIENPSAEENWLDYLNPNSKQVIAKAYIDEFLAQNAKVWDKFQFERLGFFSVDPDTTDEKKVFNRTVTLKESKEKKALSAAAAQKNKK
eukprot:GEZU01005333.1.p1 GENE.GEZU01005333.1~~GEZU01005333.1.p1  ORF type:complete len:795 (+),score=372.73 GEZU01005333.1:80-2464(+)